MSLLSAGVARCRELMQTGDGILFVGSHLVAGQRLADECPLSNGSGFDMPHLLSTCPLEIQTYRGGSEGQLQAITKQD